MIAGLSLHLRFAYNAQTRYLYGHGIAHAISTTLRITQYLSSDPEVRAVELVEQSARKETAGLLVQVLGHVAHRGRVLSTTK